MFEEGHELENEGREVGKRGLSTPAIICIVAGVVIFVIPMILGTLAGILLPVIHGAKEKAGVSAVTQQLRGLAILVAFHRDEHGRYPKSWEELRNPSGEPGGEIADLTDAMLHDLVNEQPLLLEVGEASARVGWLGIDGVEGGTGVDTDLWIDVPE